jgi:hypothetical protein
MAASPPRRDFRVGAEGARAPTETGQRRNVVSKLLNIRDFRPVTGFPPAMKTRYN